MAVGLAAIVLTLAGCSEAVTVRAPTSTSPSGAVELRSSPIDPDAPSEAERQYLKSVRALGSGILLFERATDTQLLVAGWQACAEMNVGSRATEIVVIEGEKRDATGVYRISGLVVSSADLYLC
ncbi:hypothetical protein AB0230_04445 [Microbacterium sp. NPDC089190]|uniref:hypothetical protein n=1 Tax=Microbacterium sp. NPDC089190 TaxID=3155063 RepID=UPI00344CD5AF